jgi:hypothetical protein
MNDHARHRLLLQGLLGDEHVEQFATNVSFHHSIELLARMLPPMIDGLAAVQAEDASQTARYMDLLRRGLPIPEDLLEDLTRMAYGSPGEAMRAQKPEGCSCPDPLRAADPHCPIHGFMTDIGLGGRREPAEPGVDVSDSTIADTSWRDGAR